LGEARNLRLALARQRITAMDVKTRLKGYALHVERLSQDERKWIDAEIAGQGIGLTPYDSRKLAELLVDEGWGRTLEVGGHLKLSLTNRGFNDIAKLRWSKSWQWLDRHPSVGGAVAGALTGGLVNGLFKLFEIVLW
jgi:hypothetical protein